MTKGQKVVAQAEKYLGVGEPWGRNRGPQVDKWERRWGLIGEPWCGMFADAMFAEAGVSDSGLCHPSTYQICVNANRIGANWNGVHPIPPGSLWIKCGTHVNIVRYDNHDGTVSCIDGNHNNAVSYSRRYIYQGKIIVPPAVRDEIYVPPTFEYWLEDTQAKQKLVKVRNKVAVWRTKAARDKTLLQLKKNNPKKHYRPISRVDKKGIRRYYIIEGPLRYYGPYDTKEARTKAKKILEKRLGHVLREFRKLRKG